MQTPITSIYRVLLDFRFTLPGDMFANIDRIKFVKSPVLFIHGTRDEIVAKDHSEALFKACQHDRKYTYYVENAGHNNLEVVGGDEFYHTIQNFILSLDK